MSKFKIPGQTGGGKKLQTGGRTYAESLGARPATPQEKQQAVRQGILRNPNTRAYTLPDGTILSNRAMQQRASFVRYGETLSLEQRADLLARNPDYRSGAGVKSHWVRSVMRNQTSSGRSAGTLWAKGMKYRDVERDPRFKMIWEHWQDIRNKKGGDKDAHGIRHSGKWWSAQKLDFLKRYGLLTYVNGEWIS